MAEGQGNLAGVPVPPEKKTRAEMTRVHDRELKAIERIVREMNNLEDEDAAARVMKYLADRYNTEASLG